MTLPTVMRLPRTLICGVALLWLASLRIVTTEQAATKPGDQQAARAHAAVFETSDGCLACHNSLTAPSGEDVSIGSSWRASLMANSSRDPYWHAAVRRETIDHAGSRADIEDECAICHMPMARATAHLGGGKGQVFAHLPASNDGNPIDRLAHDGVSCTLCHQITGDKLGTRDSFTGGFVVSPPTPAPEPSGGRPIFGPFQIEKGQTRIMRSVTGFVPSEAAHIRESELCATCHTLITKALGPSGEVIGELPEQMLYLEWKHSAYQDDEKRSCQSCHMPVVEEDTPIASVLGSPRKGFARHTFVGGNFFMLRMLNRFRTDLGVAALPQEMDASATRTIANLRENTVDLQLGSPSVAGGELAVDVLVRNLTGHKFPTAYPSRRAWLHVTVRDRAGRIVFESGRLRADGSIDGNDNDADGSRYEPHHLEIEQPSDVQIYESIMRDRAGAPTTGLLTAIGYLKDNRLLPRGFDKASADAEIAVIGGAREDPTFTADGDRVRYVAPVNAADGPFEVAAELLFQPIAFRWADNLKKYDAPETRRFNGYYDSMSNVSAEVIASRTRRSE